MWHNCSLNSVITNITNLSIFICSQLLLTKKEKKEKGRNANSNPCWLKWYMYVLRLTLDQLLYLSDYKILLTIRCTCIFTAYIWKYYQHFRFRIPYCNLNYAVHKNLFCFEPTAIKTQNNSTDNSCSVLLIKPATLMATAEHAEYFGSWTWTHQQWAIREVRGNISVNIYHFYNTSDLFHFLLYLWTARSAQILGSIFQDRKCTSYSKNYSNILFNIIHVIMHQRCDRNTQSEIQILCNYINSDWRYRT
jgi:hypothetical protein